MVEIVKAVNAIDEYLKQSPERRIHFECPLRLLLSRIMSDIFL